MDNQKILTPIKAIRAKCIDCMCGLTHEVKLCPVTDCSLWPYRMGHNPNRKGKGGKFAPKDAIQVEVLRDKETGDIWYATVDASEISEGEEGYRE